MVEGPLVGEDLTPVCHRADSLAAEGRYQEAVRVYQEFTDAGTQDAEVLYRLGELFVSWGRADIAKGEVYAPFQLRFPWGAFPFPTRDHYPLPKTARAIEYFREALDQDSGHKGALSGLALLLVQELETVREGARLAQRAAAAAHDDDRGHLAMAVLGLRQADWHLARAASSEAARLNAESVEAAAIKLFAEAVLGEAGKDVDFKDLSADGLIFLAGQLSQALETGGLPESPDPAAPLQALAHRLLDHAERALLETQAMVFAVRCLDHARRLEPAGGGTARVAGLLLFKSGIFDYSERAFRYALNVNPDDQAAQRYLALARLGGASDNKLDMVASDVNADDLIDLAETLAAQLSFETASALSGKALAKDPQSLAAGLLHAQLCALQGDIAAATETLEKAYAQHPASPEIEGDLANIYLSQARLSDAWPLYESRLRRRRGSTPRAVPEVPRWTGQPLDRGTVLIWREEGIGDEIRFSSCLPDAVDRLPGRITYECDPRLQSLYARSFPNIHVRSENLAGGDIGHFDAHMPAGSLPGLFRGTLADFPPDGAFLSADPARVANWRNRLDELGAGPKVGIGWRSLNAGWHKLPLHSRLADWSPIAAIHGIHLVNLQCGLRVGEIEAGATALQTSIHNFEDLDLENDMEDVAALMMALDVIVSCQCWLLHLGGALGAKVYTFNAQPNPYLMGQKTNPWAPTVEVVYRRHGEDWHGPMTEIATRIRNRFSLGDD